MGKEAIISKKRARNLIYNFHKEKRKGKKSVSVTFDAKELKEYIDGQIKEEKASKIRFYFAQYGDNIKNATKDMKGHKTLVLVPVRVVNGKEQELYEDKAKLPVNMLATFNEGEICPPNRGCEDEDSLYHITLVRPEAGYKPREQDK